MGEVAGQSPRSTESGEASSAARRRERNRAEMRQMIREAARRIVNEQGIAALSMRAVAAEIGYSAAALYEYFPSKDRLCDSLFFEGAEGLAGRMRDAIEQQPPGSSALERLAAAGAAYRAAALEQPDLYRLIFSNPIPSDAPESGRGPQGDSAFSFLVDLFRQGIAAGEIAEGDPEVAALHAWASVHGFVTLEILGLLPGHLPELRDELFNSSRVWLRNGLAPRLRGN
jgi:AcrR family transcriptional regulator